MSVSTDQIAALEQRIAYIEGRFAEQDARSAHHAAKLEEERRRRAAQAKEWARARVRERAQEIFAIARDVANSTLDGEVAEMVREQHDRMVVELEALHLEEAAERAAALGLPPGADVTPFIQPVERVFQ